MGYLDAEMNYLARRAQAKGIELDELVNQLLKREIEITSRPASSRSGWKVIDPSANGTYLRKDT
jgi:hypothetical protein